MTLSASEHQLEASETDAGKRLDLFVGEALGLSRAKLKQLFEAGAVKVNGRAARKGQLLAKGQKIAVTVEAEQSTAAQPDAAAELTVLHADAQLLFIDKPAGMPSHPLRPGETGTVANALIARYPECAAASEDAREGGLCHRLDVETSGVLLAARDRESWKAMREAFGTRSVDKRYLALVRGPLVDEGTIALPLRHHPRHADRVEPAPDTEDGGGREAHSEFRVLARAGDASLVEVRIHTGVLHQVRAHLAAIGAPIVGDLHYGGKAEPGLTRFFLHAASLGVEHPVTRQPLTVRSALAPDLRAVLRARGLPEDVGPAATLSSP